MSTPRPTVDVLGVGFGPSNLALAIAIDDHNACAPPDQRLAARFVEQQAAFGWHRGMLLEGATMHSFLKDLVTMRDPTSPRSFLSYLRDKGRLADFINNKSLFPSRVEFHDYLEWAASGVEELVDHGTRAVAVHPVRRDDEAAVTELDVVLRDLATGERRTVRTGNLVLATGLMPSLPPGVERGPAVLAQQRAPAPPRRHRRGVRGRRRSAGAPAVRGRRRGAERGRDDQHAQRVRTRFAPTLARTTWALVRGVSGGAFFSDYPTSWSGVVLADAGTSFGAFAAGKTGAGGRLSYEQAGQIDDCDVILHLADTRGNVDANTSTLLAQPAFRALRAVSAGRLFPLPKYYCAHYKQGDAVLSYLEGLLPRL